MSRRGGIFGEDGLFAEQVVGGVFADQAPLPKPGEANIVTYRCDEPACGETWVAAFGEQLPEDWLCPAHALKSSRAEPTIVRDEWESGLLSPQAAEAAAEVYSPAWAAGRLLPHPIGQQIPDAEPDLSSADLDQAEQSVGFGPGSLPHDSRSLGDALVTQPDNPVAHPLPTQRSPLINGWWFAFIVILVLAIAGLVLYAQALRSQISGYEITLSMENTMSFEQHAAIQRIECTGHEVQRCSGIVLSDTQNLPARYSCDSTHCAFECK